MSDPVYDSQFARDMQRERFTQAALTGLLSGVDVISMMESGRKLPGKQIAEAALILADHTIDALNAPAFEFRPPAATEPGPEPQESGSQPPTTSGGPAPLGADATPMPASSPTASEPQAPAGKSEHPQSWKRTAAPLSKG